MIDKSGYRLNVGIILTNKNHQLFWGRRAGNNNAWQFPQGGVQDYETLEETMYRELFEETGLGSDDVTIISTTKRWLYYKLPEHMRRHFQTPLCIGQKQKWFLLLLKSDDSKVCLDATETPEFDKWLWVDYWYPLQQVIYFKREIYHKVLIEFEPRIKKI